jgi:hypothetical protein
VPGRKRDWATGSVDGGTAEVVLPSGTLVAVGVSLDGDIGAAHEGQKRLPSGAVLEQVAQRIIGALDWRRPYHNRSSERISGIHGSLRAGV